MSNVKRLVGTTLAAVAIATAVAPAAGAATVAPTTHASKHINTQPDRRCHRWGFFHHHRRCNSW
ncbi:MAG TPA: hypothetical protein VHV82_05365 [Sporichthyaceae bacterium]|jgi:hypothetical protein|nr:hypothetical protein [Sporichthyaceae bacterium]